MTFATRVLKEFLDSTEGDLEAVQKDFETARSTYVAAVEFFGENAKTTSCQSFFSTFVRFSAAYKQAVKVAFMFKLLDRRII